MTETLKDFLATQEQDIIFVVPRGVDNETIFQTIAKSLTEKTLVLSDLDIDVSSKYLKEGSLDQEIEDLGKVTSFLIATPKPYFPAYNFEGIRNIFLLPYPSPERTINGLANFFDQGVWVRVAGGDTLILEKDEIEMSVRQGQNYREVRKIEIQNKGSRNKKEQYEASIRLRSLQAGNFVYPKNVQKELRKPRERRAKLAPDTLEDQGGWISEETWAPLIRENPKFQHVLSRISPRKKTVIYTRFKEHYGSTLLSSLIQLQGGEVTVLSGDIKSVNTRTKMITTFNKAKTGNLILTILPPENLTNVDQLIILEGVEIELLKKLVSLISGSLDRPLKLIFMIARRSSDLFFYTPFERSIKDQVDAAERAIARCHYQLQGKMVSEL